MIILPAEKQLDWRRPPVVTLGIIVITALIHGLWQVDDDALYDDAVTRYLDAGFLEVEKPLFETYIEREGTDADKADLEYYWDEEILEEEEHVRLQAWYILFRRDFFRHIEPDMHQYLDPVDLPRWRALRPELDAQIGRTSDFVGALNYREFAFYKLFTHQFLHADWNHWLGNMVFLFVVGFTVEAALGSGLFLLCFLLSGVGACLFEWPFVREAYMTSLGASGSISGVMAMYVMLYRLRKIQFFYWAWIRAGYIRLPAIVVLPFWLAKEVIAEFSETGSQVAYMAHAGGFVTGAVLVAGIQYFRRHAIDEDWLTAKPDEPDPYRKALDKLYRQLSAFQFQPGMETLQALLKEHSEEPDLLVLQARLSAFLKPESYPGIVKKILQKSTSRTGFIETQETLWREYRNAGHEPLGDDLELQLGVRFLKLDNSQGAEIILNELVEKNIKLPMMIKLADALARKYELSNGVKSRRYREIAQIVADQALGG